MHRKLIDLCTIQYGYAFNASLFTEDESFPPIIRIRDVKRGYSETYYSGNYSGNYIIRKGDILIGMDGEFNIAKWQSQDALLNQRVCKVNPNANVNGDYLLYALSRKLKSIEENTAFVTVKHLSAKELNKIVIKAPDYSQQTRVANTINSLLYVIAKYQSLLAKLDELVKARFVEMFGVIRPDSSYTLLKEVCKIERGGSPRPISDYVTDNSDGVNWIKIGDANPDGYIYSTAEKIRREGVKKSRFVKTGDLLLSNSMSFGRPYILKIDGCIHDGWLVLQFDKGILNTTFMRTYLSMPEVYDIFTKMAVGGVVNNLNKDMVGKLPIFVPEIARQTSFAAFVEQVDKSKVVVQKALDKAQQLYDSLMQQYFD